MQHANQIAYIKVGVGLPRADLDFLSPSVWFRRQHSGVVHQATGGDDEHLYRIPGATTITAEI